MLSRITLAAVAGILLSLAAVGVSEARQVYDTGVFFRIVAHGRAPKCDGQDWVLITAKRQHVRPLFKPTLLGGGDIHVLGNPDPVTAKNYFLVARPVEYPAGSGTWQLRVVTSLDGRSGLTATFDCRR